MRRAKYIAALILAVSLVPEPGQSQSAPDRFAFVIGNYGYERRSDGHPMNSSKFNLVTPERDVPQYVEVLRNQLGWTILNSAVTDRTSSSMRNDLDKAAAQITAGSEVLFVFNGHGFSQGQANYLVGVPEDGERYDDVGEMVTGSIRLQEVIEVLSRSRPSRIVLVINACGDEPLVSDANKAPARAAYDAHVEEVLVLYSSSPKGVAYDVRDTLERDDDSYLSVFTRAFLPLMTENRPLLSIFAETRIEVERLSKYAALDRGLPDRQGLQIPHVLFDTIDGQFSLANASATRADAASLANWRLDAQACRFNPLNLDEALALRPTPAFDDSAEGKAIRACILAAALGDLGIEKLTYDTDRGGVVVSNSSNEGNIRQGDLISRAIILDDARNRTQMRISGIDTFYELLEDHYFKEGWLLSLLRTREEGSNSDTRFESIRF